MWVGSNPTEVIVTAANGANALAIARKLYTPARIIRAREI